MTVKQRSPYQLAKNGIPFGFNEIREGVYVNFASGDIIITGDPSEDDTHNCDHMGCQQEHVLIRGRITQN